MYKTWFQLLKRELKYINGVNVETFTEDYKGKCSCINYSTNDLTAANLQTHQDTWTVETRFTNRITSGDRIKLLDDGSTYDVIGVPENVRRENKTLKFKMVRVNGKKA